MPTDHEIRLQNPVSDHFSSFIFGNATVCDRVVKQDSHAGQSVAICGAGPSLADTAADYVNGADEVWGCNSALTWLAENGHRVTHGFTVDQTPHMLEEWATTPNVPYLLASSVHPHLVDLLRSRDGDLTFFHNYVGIDERPVSYAVCHTCNKALAQGLTVCPDCGNANTETHTMDYEDWLYSMLYEPTVRAGAGLNTASRAVDVALFMGFERIALLGADCALKIITPRPPCAAGSPEHMEWLRSGVVMHADGSHALRSGATAVTLGATIDGRYWETKPDMAITAVWLADMARAHKGRLELVGDTLPNAIRDKPDKFLARMPSLTNAKGQSIRYCPSSEL